MAGQFRGMTQSPFGPQKKKSERFLHQHNFGLKLKKISYELDSIIYDYKKIGNLDVEDYSKDLKTNIWEFSEFERTLKAYKFVDIEFNSKLENNKDSTFRCVRISPTVNSFHYRILEKVLDEFNILDYPKKEIVEGDFSYNIPALAGENYKVLGMGYSMIRPDDIFMFNKSESEHYKIGPSEDFFSFLRDLKVSPYQENSKHKYEDYF